MPEIKVSETTYLRLLKSAVSFDDQPEDVIIRLLDAAGSKTSDSSEQPAERKAPTRAAPGSVLPIHAYWGPILRVLEDRGGAAHSNDVIDALEERMDGMFTPQDRERLRSGDIRWRNRTRFARLRMKEKGLLSDASDRGVWEITPEGREFLGTWEAETRLG